MAVGSVLFTWIEIFCVQLSKNHWTVCHNTISCGVFPSVKGMVNSFSVLWTQPQPVAPGMLADGADGVWERSDPCPPHPSWQWIWVWTTDRQHSAGTKISLVVCMCAHACVHACMQVGVCVFVVSNYVSVTCEDVMDTLCELYWPLKGGGGGVGVCLCVCLCSVTYHCDCHLSGCDGHSVWAVLAPQGRGHVGGAVCEEGTLPRNQRCHRLWATWLLWTGSSPVRTGKQSPFMKLRGEKTHTHKKTKHIFSWTVNCILPYRHKKYFKKQHTCVYRYWVVCKHAKRGTFEMEEDGCCDKMRVLLFFSGHG